MKYFYIIQRNGQIHEIQFTQERFAESFNQWQKGGLIIFSKLGLGINAVDVSNIFSEDQYQSYIDSAEPKMYIRNGAWYTRDNRAKPFRYEKWRQDEIDTQMKIEAPKEEERNPEEVKKLIAKYKPEFLKRVKSKC